jgi:hypothetical protein
MTDEFSGILSPLPANPVLAGQQHMLAYITPGEATSLRAQGGGVTPTGGQYRGPGGIASFAPVGASGTAAAAGRGTVSVPGIGTPHSPGQYGGGPSAQGVTGNPAHTAAVAKSAKDAEVSRKALVKHRINEQYSELNSLDPKTIAYADKRAEITDSMKAAVKDGYVSQAISKANDIANMFKPDRLGNVTLGYVTKSGDRISSTDMANMTPAQYSSAMEGASPEGDPNSALGIFSNLASFAMPGLGGTLFGLARAGSEVAEGRIPGSGILSGLFGVDMPTLGEISGELPSLPSLPTLDQLTFGLLNGDDTVSRPAQVPAQVPADTDADAAALARRAVSERVVQPAYSPFPRPTFTFHPNVGKLEPSS